MTANAIIIGASTNRSRSPQRERRSLASEARNHARTPIPQPVIQSLPAAAPCNTVLHGNCVEVMRGLAAGTADFILTDPPYVTRYTSRDGRTVPNNDNFAWLKPAFAEMYRVLARNSFCVSFYGWANADLFTTAFRAAGFRFVGHLAFPKPYPLSCKYLSCRHESAYLLAKGSPAVPHQAIADVIPWTTYSGNKLHPTQKPVEVLKPLIAAFCPPGGIVLDRFCGSGSTLAAARDLNRRYLGIERDASYYGIATRRLASD